MKKTITKSLHYSNATYTVEWAEGNFDIAFVLEIEGEKITVPFRVKEAMGLASDLVNICLFKEAVETNEDKKGERTSEE